MRSLHYALTTAGPRTMAIASPAVLLRLVTLGGNASARSYPQTIDTASMHGLVPRHGTSTSPHDSNVVGSGTSTFHFAMADGEGLESADAMADF